MYSIYRFLFSFILLILLTISNFIRTNSTNFTTNPIISILIYEWITFTLWILCMFYVTEKGTKAVYSDQFVIPLAIYQQFVQLLDFIIFGASMNNLLKYTFDFDEKNILQYLCTTTKGNDYKYTSQSNARLHIIKNILFQNQKIYKQLLYATNDKNQIACLYYAVMANQLNIVQFFIEDKINKMDINWIDNNDQTILHIAIQRNYNEMIQYLLKCKDLNIGLKDSMNRTYMHYAAMTQSIQIIKYFNQFNENEKLSFSSMDDYGKTMLFYAENKDLILYLIAEYGLNINAIDLAGKTILFHCIADNKLQTTKYLIEECNINVNITDNNGNLAYFFCHTVEMANYMLNKCNIDINGHLNNSGQSVIFNAISKHYSNDLCKYYIEICDINIQQIDKYNKTLIDIAVEYLNVSQVQYLMSKLNKINHRQTIYKIGPKPENTENTENTIPELVVIKSTESLHENDHEEKDVINIKTWLCAKDKLILSLYKLFELGYNTNNIMNGINKNGNIHNIHYIIQSMKFVNNNNNNNKLYEFGIQIIQEMIIKNNYLIDMEDNNKNTAVYYCIDSQVYELVILFVENGSNLYHQNLNKQSPLEYAIQKCKSIQICEYLTETKYNSPCTYNTNLSPYNSPTYNNIIVVSNEETSVESKIEIVENNNNVEMVENIIENDNHDDIPPNLLQKTIKFLSESPVENIRNEDNINEESINDNESNGSVFDENNNNDNNNGMAMENNNKLVHEKNVTLTSDELKHSDNANDENSIIS